MAVTTEDVTRIAWLAKLDFDDHQKTQICKQLHKIVGFIEKLNELDTDSVPPTHHVLDIKNKLRKDEIQPSLSSQEVLMNAPRIKGRYFSVPKVISQEEAES